MISARHGATLFFGAMFFSSVLLGMVLVERVREQGKLHVTFLNVGQGDAIVIRTPFAQTILIDGGPNPQAGARLSRALPFFDKTIDLLIVTHPHADHFVGFLDLLKRVPVKSVVLNGVSNETPEYSAFMRALEKRDIPLIIAHDGMRFVFNADLYLVLLHPFKEKKPPLIREDLNDSSVVAKMAYKQVSFLFMGDAGTAVEDQLIENVAPLLDTDVLKIGHHGSSDATSEAFLAAVTPKISVISVGEKNSYGHPHARLLKRLERLNTPFFRTDRDGDIRMTTDGITLLFSAS